MSAQFQFPAPRFGISIRMHFVAGRTWFFIVDGRGHQIQELPGLPGLQDITTDWSAITKTWNDLHRLYP